MTSTSQSVNTPEGDRVCFCIPARFESTRLPQKLLLKFGQQSCLEKTYIQTTKSAFSKDDNSNIFILTDSKKLAEVMNKHIATTFPGAAQNIIMTSLDCVNGTDRISKYLDKIPTHYQYIVNVQADEPFISPHNIDHAITEHIKNVTNEPPQTSLGVFYTTLHEENNTKAYLQSTASLKVVVDRNNNVMYYSRNVVPWNKENKLQQPLSKYKTFTGIYVFNRIKLEGYKDMSTTEYQLEEDCEQLKILENGYSIKSYPTIEYNEISLNTPDDYTYLLNKYSAQLGTAMIL